MAKGYGPHRIETTHGNSLVMGTAKVLVEVAPDVYTRKEVRLLEKGDLVVYRKDHIDTDLDRVHPSLCESPRYDAAWKTVYSKTTPPPITRLQHELFKAIAPKIGQEASGLEDKLGADPEVLEPFVSYIHRALESDSRTRDHADSTVRNWLTGETYLPQDPAVLLAIADSTNSPSLNKLAEQEFRRQYQLFVTVRQGIMRYLSSGGQEALESSESEESEPVKQGERTSLRPEIKIILQKFGHSVNKQYSTAYVHKVESLRGQEAAKVVHDERDPHLVRGVICKVPEDLERKTRSLQQLYEDQELCGQALDWTLHRASKVAYPDFNKFVRESVYGLAPATRWMADSSVYVGNLMRAPVFAILHPNKSNMERIEEIRKSVMPHKIDTDHFLKLAEPLVFDLVSGEVDKALGTDKGSTLKLVQLVHGMESIVHSLGVKPLLNQLSDLSAQVSLGRNVASAESRADRIYKLIKDTHGIDLSVATKTLASYFGSSICRQQQIGMDTVFEQNDPLVQEIRLDAKLSKNHKGFVTKEEVKARVAQYGVSQFVDFMHPYLFVES